MLNAVTHLAGMQEQAVLIGDISGKGRVDPYPFVQRLAPGHADDVAVVVGVPGFGEAGDVARRDAHGQKGLGEADGEGAAVVAAAVAAGAVVDVAQVARAFGYAVAAVVADVVVHPVQQVLDAADVAAVAGDAVEVEALVR